MARAKSVVLTKEEKKAVVTELKGKIKAVAAKDNITAIKIKSSRMLFATGFLRKVFGDRLTLYPHGGHCGNLNYRVNSDAMLEFFRG
mgnify:CR=1 FL=1